MDKFREDIENIRMKLSDRCDILVKHEQEYEEEGRTEQAKVCDIKLKSFLMILGELDKALK